MAILTSVTLDTLVWWVIGLPLALAALSLVLNAWSALRPDRGDIGLDAATAGIVASLPALALGLALLTGVLAPAQFSASWLVLGATLGADAATGAFALLTGVLWLAASLGLRGYFSAEVRRRLTPWWTLALAGNVALAVTLDALTYFVFFALMSIASYGLVVQRGDAQASRAGRIYLTYVIAGEIILFLALALASFHPAWAAAAVAIGFGIKIGVLGLHSWLPLAHGAAPAPASAVLSGAMLKAGLLGWMRFFELPPEATWGAETLMALGLAGAVLGALLGITQREPKTVLAYSSVSQMGLIVLGFGMALEAELAPEVMAATFGLLALNHALAKGALFLGVPLLQRTTGRRRHVALMLLSVPAVTLVGLALTSGAMAKLELQALAQMLPAAYASAVLYALPVCATGTALVLMRAFRLFPRGEDDSAGWATWSSVLVLVAASTVIVAALPLASGATVDGWSAQVSFQGIAKSAAPLAVAGVVLWLWQRVGWRALGAPVGDVVVWLERVAGWSRRWLLERARGMDVRPGLHPPPIAVRWTGVLTGKADQLAGAAREASMVCAASVAVVVTLLLMFL